MKKQYVLFVLCLLHFSQSSADIYKYIAKDGRIYYKDCQVNDNFKRIIKTLIKTRECVVSTKDLDIRNDIVFVYDYPFTGRYETYYPSENKKGIAHLKDGKLNGLMTVWDENGNVALETSFIDGKSTLVKDAQSK